MNLKQQIGQRIKQLRIKNKLTQAELAEKVDIASKYQSFIETGNSYPSSDLIEKYAKVFNIEPAEVLYINKAKLKSDTINKINEDLQHFTIEQLDKLYNIIKTEQF